MDKKTDFLKKFIVLFSLFCSASAFAQFFEQNPEVLDTADLVVTYSHLW
jgi:hypothetical protein